MFKKKKKISIKNNSTTTLQLERMAKDIKNFRGVFVKNKLPKKPLWNECAIVNLDNDDGVGTHWVAYKKFGNNIIYFDSFVKLKPPEELVQYWGEDKIIKYNRDSFQTFDETNCGQWAIKFLKNV